jgi:thymidine kinase
MAKLYFKYGAMGSSKTAQALITKFNYEERGMKVWLIKPSKDTRDGSSVIRSRIGIQGVADNIGPDTDILARFRDLLASGLDVVIADECQFFEEGQIDDLRTIVDDYNVPVLCFGLRTDFRTRMFPGSSRLFELSDSITEIKTICECGLKASVNARLDSSGRITTVGDQVYLGGNESYVAMCYRCWKKHIREQNEVSQAE